MTIRGYERTSTRSQKLNNQREMLTKAGCEVIYSEQLSGRKSDRPELLRLLSDIKPGDKVIVVSLSRFGRSVEDLIKHVGLVEAAGCEFASLTEKIDTSSAAGKLFFHMVAAFSQYFSDVTRERIMDGLDTARSDGKVLGPPPKTTEQTRKMAQSLLDSGEMVKSVAGALKIHRSTLWRALKK